MGHGLREAFLEAIDLVMQWEDDQQEPTVDVRGRQMPVTQICGLVWNCTDVLGSRARDHIADLVHWEVDVPRGLSVAQTARLLKGVVADALNTK